MDEDPPAAGASREVPEREERAARLRGIRVTLGVIGLVVSLVSLIVRCSASSDSGQVTPAVVACPGSEGIVRTLAEPGHATVTSVTFSPDGKLLAVAGGTLGKTFIWSIRRVTSS